MPNTVRQLFATILIYNSPSDPKTLWEEFKSEMSEDFLRDQPKDVEGALEKALQKIELFMQSMGRSIDDFGLRHLGMGTTREEIYARDFEREQNIEVPNSDLLAIQQLNVRQKQAYEEVVFATNIDKGGFFFIDGPDGTGKYFLYRASLATIISQGNIALAVASSGVAASLLPGGRTAHSRFKLPIFIDESMTCSISKQSAQAKLILAAKLIIWDEASMAHRRIVETLDDLLRDLTVQDLIFGRKTIVFGGDFRQTIPVIPGGTKEDEIDACLVKSGLWQFVRKIKLVDNIRARDDPLFVEYLLRIGNGVEPHDDDNNIQLQHDMCILPAHSEEPLDILINSVFPSFTAYFENPFTVMQRAILTPKNECVHEINNSLINKCPGDYVDYTSNDVTNDESQQSQYQDFLNSVDVAGLPPHLLRLKVNSPIMLFRNINPAECLCSDTRLICRDLGRKVIGVEIASGENKGTYVFIPRIPLEPSDRKKCPIPFKRHQFPVRLCFAMTINKAQGQTLDQVGIYLPEPVFSHGQLYVALSRVKRAAALKILIRPPTVDRAITTKTRNVVYKEVLQHDDEI